MKALKVTQIRSGIGFPKAQKTALKSLGLRRLRHTVTVPDNAASRGLLLRVRHLVRIEEE